MTITTLKRKLGRRFFGVTAKDWRTRCDAEAVALETVLQWGPDDGNLIIAGAAGKGKTMLASIAVGVCLSRGIGRIAWEHWTDLVQLLTDAARGDETAHGRLRWIGESADVCVIDDLCCSQRDISHAVREQFQLLTDRRYRDRLPFVITCNTLGNGDISRTLGERTARRLNEGSTVVAAVW